MNPQIAVAFAVAVVVAQPFQQAEARSFSGAERVELLEIFTSLGVSTNIHGSTDLLVTPVPPGGYALSVSNASPLYPLTLNNGSGLTNMSAASLSTGTLPLARLEASVTLLGQLIALGNESDLNGTSITNISLATGVTGTLPIGSGGTGSATINFVTNSQSIGGGTNIVNGWVGNGILQFKSLKHAGPIRLLDSLAGIDGLTISFDGSQSFNASGGTNFSATQVVLLTGNQTVGGEKSFTNNMTATGINAQDVIVTNGLGLVRARKLNLSPTNGETSSIGHPGSDDGTLVLTGHNDWETQLNLLGGLGTTNQNAAVGLTNDEVTKAYQMRYNAASGEMDFYDYIDDVVMLSLTNGVATVNGNLTFSNATDRVVSMQDSVGAGPAFTIHGSDQSSGSGSAGNILIRAGTALASSVTAGGSVTLLSGDSGNEGFGGTFNLGSGDGNDGGVFNFYTGDGIGNGQDGFGSGGDLNVWTGAPGGGAYGNVTWNYDLNTAAKTGKFLIGTNATSSASIAQVNGDFDVSGVFNQVPLSFSLPVTTLLGTTSNTFAHQTVPAGKTVTINHVQSITEAGAVPAATQLVRIYDASNGQTLLATNGNWTGTITITNGLRWYARFENNAVTAITVSASVHGNLK